jgi:hypothetical protein
VTVGMPTRVQVGAWRYKVDTSADAVLKMRAETSADCVGRVRHTEQTITIKPEMAADQLRDTLLHEVLHAVHSFVGMDVADECGCEEFVHRLCPTLLDTLRRNPDLVTYLMEP